MVGGVLLALSICMLIQPAEELLVSNETETAVARLLVARSADLAVEVFEYTPEMEGQPEGLVTVPLSPLMYLLAGDELTVPEGASVVLLCFADSTRQRHTGPTRLRITAAGIEALNGGGPAPEIEVAHVLEAPLEVSDRVSQRGAVSVLRNVSDEVPVPLYPDNVMVVPGTVELEWIYTGPDGAGNLVLHDYEGTKVFATEVMLAAGEQAVDVAVGETYFWWVDPPDGGGVPAFFSVIGEGDWAQVLAACASCGLPAGTIVDALGATDSVEDLAYLIAVFQYYDLQGEAKAAIARLAAVLEPGQ